MKITIINDSEHDYEITVEWDEPERENTMGMMIDAALSASRLILEMVKKCHCREDAGTLTNFLFRTARDATDSVLDDYYREDDEEKLFRELIESSFLEWMESLTEYGIENERDFVERFSDTELTLDFKVQEGEVELFIRDNCGTVLPVDRFPANLGRDPESESNFRARCCAAYFLAEEVFDRLYGDEANPLRLSDDPERFTERVASIICGGRKTF